MTIDLLDVLLVVAFCFGKPVPWWLWCLGVISMYGSNVGAERIKKSLERIASK